MELNKIYNENCLTTTKRIPDNSIDCIITSPPYWQCRDYGYPEQWGLEATFYEYLEHLWEFMGEAYRILKMEGTCWVNLGDTYSTQSGTNLALARGTHKKQESTYLTNRGESPLLIKDATLPNKCLLLLPHRFAIGCIDKGWIMRNDCIWAKRNSMPESVLDRFSKKHEYFFFMVKSEDYYFDMDSIRDKCPPLNRWGGNKLKAVGISKWDLGTGQQSYRNRDMQPNNGMKNPGSVSDFWDIPTKPSKEDHYASYNEFLLKKPVLGGCPEGGIIYDPFMGTGETAITAIKYKRQFVGSDGNKKYCQIAERRIKQHLAMPKTFFNL